MHKLNLDKKSLRKFGITMAIAFAIFTICLLIRHKHQILPTSLLASFFLLFAFIWPGSLKPVYIGWMKLAFVLGWINTRLILIILFYLVFTPISIIVRILRIDLLDRRFKKNEVSYWKKKETIGFGPSSYERQF